MEGKTEEIVKILKEIQNEDPDLGSLAVVSLDGLPIASLLPVDVEEDRVAAMGATLLSLGERASLELKKGNLEQVYIKGEEGYALITSIKSLAALIVMTKKDAKLGMVFLSLKKGIEALEKII